MLWLLLQGFSTLPALFPHPHHRTHQHLQLVLCKDCVRCGYKKSRVWLRNCMYVYGLSESLSYVTIKLGNHQTQHHTEVLTLLLHRAQTHLLTTFSYQCITKCINILPGQLTFLIHTQFNSAAPGCRSCRVAGTDLDKVSTQTQWLLIHSFVKHFKNPSTSIQRGLWEGRSVKLSWIHGFSNERNCCLKPLL